MKIFLVRHATPNWNQTDIPYDILPGPALSPKGEKESEALAEFMKSESVVKLYYSPFERSARTAGIVSAINEIPSVKEKGLSEWRQVDEPETRVRKRVVSVFEHVVTETADIGPIGLVSHGGPIALLLLELGMDREELASYRKMFDTSNPLPPAGVWKVEQISDEGNWNFRLAFIPKVNIARGLSY